MGTTVSTNLGLIKPDADESIRANMPTFPGWAVQNGANQDIIDNLFRGNTGTYTPTWTASTTSPTLGTGGFVEGKWIRVFPRMVFVYFRIFTGTTGFTIGSGTYRISLPFAMDASLLTFESDFLPIGKAAFLDASTPATCSAFLALYSQGVSTAIFRPSTGGIWNDTNPFAMAQGDRVSGYFMYPTSDT